MTCLNLLLVLSTTDWPCAICIRNSARNSSSARKHDVKRLLHHLVEQDRWYEKVAGSSGRGESAGFEDL